MKRATKTHRFINRFLYHLWIVCSLLHAAMFTNKKLHGARYARLHELASITSGIFSTSSLLLGYAGFGHIYQVRKTPARRELGNMLIVAPTRGGKGLLAVSQLLTWNHSVIVNDIKGDLFLQTAGYRRTLGEIIVLDPQGVGHRFDPLEGKHTEDELYAAATHLLYQSEEGDGRIFTLRATRMLTQLFLAARLEGQPPFPYVQNLLKTGLKNVAERLTTINPQLATKFLDVASEDANLEDRFLLSAWGTLTARLEPLLTETVIRSLSGSDFHPSELLFSQKPITIYLRWKEQNLLALSPLVRLLWGSFIEELTTAYDTVHGKNCHPILLLIDEAGRAAIPSLADHATTVAGRGITLWIAIQSLSQLEASYGRARANILRDNMETQLYYRPANLKTAEYLEYCLGKTSAYASSKTTHHGSETSQGQSEQGVPLLTAWDIQRMEDDRILVFHRELPPFQAKRMDWRTSPLLTSRQRMQPPFLSPLPAPENSFHPPITKNRNIFISEYIDPDTRRNMKQRNN